MIELHICPKCNTCHREIENDSFLGLLKRSATELEHAKAPGVETEKAMLLRAASYARAAACRIDMYLETGV